jgi:hypothetical protein
MILVLFFLLLLCVSINTFQLKVSSLSAPPISTSLNVVTGRYTNIHPEQPSFFPRSLDELASVISKIYNVGIKTNTEKTNCIDKYVPCIDYARKMGLNLDIDINSIINKTKKRIYEIRNTPV